MSDLVIGIDVGGTKTAAGLVDLSTGEISNRRSHPSEPHRTAQEIATSLGALVSALAAEAVAAGTPVTIAGLGVPEIVAPDRTIRSDQTFPWLGVDLSRLPGLDLPVIVESDVRGAALAEARFGAGTECPLFLYVSIGTGVGSAVVIDGAPLVGIHGAALVLTSGTTTEWCNGEQKRSFVIEEVASGLGIAREYARVSGEAGVTAEYVFARYTGGDRLAARVVERAALLLGQAIARAVDLVDPGRIVIGGGLGIGSDLFRETVVAGMRERIWLPAARGIPVVTASLGPDAGIVGAALAAAEQRIARTDGNRTGALPSHNTRRR